MANKKFLKWYYSQPHYCGFGLTDHFELGVDGQMYLGDDVYCGGWDNYDIPDDDIRALATKEFKEYYDWMENHDPDNDDHVNHGFDLYMKAVWSIEGEEVDYENLGI